MGGGVPLRDMSPFGFIVMDETQTPLDAYYWMLLWGRIARGESEVIGFTKICKDLYTASCNLSIVLCPEESNDAPALGRRL